MNWLRKLFSNDDIILHAKECHNDSPFRRKQLKAVRKAITRIRNKGYIYLKSNNQVCEELKKLGYDCKYEFHSSLFSEDTDRIVTAPVSLKATEYEINKKMFE